MKKIIVAANWKLNKSPAETRQFFHSFLELTKKNSAVAASLGNSMDLVFFPSAISIEATSQSLKGSGIDFGVQNVYFESQGAFTGENSAKVVKELNGRAILVGHSERRQYFSETNQFLNKKIQHVLGSDLSPMYCIGETLNEREKGQTESILLAQLTDGLKGIEASKAKSLVIAYEPVWAIGTGKVATPEQVEETHAFVQKTLVALGFPNTPILYGGSVKANNATELIRLPFVSGFLVGGASLEPQSFSDLINSSLKGLVSKLNATRDA